MATGPEGSDLLIQLSFLRCHKELRPQALSSWLSECGRGAGLSAFTPVSHVLASGHGLSSPVSTWPWNQPSQWTQEGKQSWACSWGPALRATHSRAQDPLFLANLVQTLPFALPVSLLLCCQWRFTCPVSYCFPLLSFCKRRSGIMTQENTPKATAPSSSFSLNIQRSWKGRLLRFTRQSSGACPSIQARPLSAPVDLALLTPGCDDVPFSVIHCGYNPKAPSLRTVV